MAGNPDFKSMFKAARGQRESVPAKLTKEQIRLLKAQRAAQQAQDASQAANREGSSQSVPVEDRTDAKLANGSTMGMVMRPPPPRSATAGPLAAPQPRPLSGSPQPQTPTPLVDGKVVFREDSQMTRASPAPGSVYSDASTGAVAHEAAGGNNTVESSRLARLNSGPSNRGMMSDDQTPGGLPGGFFEEHVAQSEAGAASDSRLAGRTHSAGEALSAAASGIGAGASAADGTATSAGGHGQTDGLPEGFFEGPSARAQSIEDETNPQPVQYAASVSSQQHTQGDAGAQGPLPKGFFANKDADARARGQEPPKKKSKAETFDEFMVSIADDVKEVEEREQAEAEEAAQDRLAREAFEQRMRLQRIEELRAKKAPTGVLPDAEGSAAEGLEAQLAASLGKRKRAVAALDSVLGALDADDDDEEEEVLDWRAKTV